LAGSPAGHLRLINCIIGLGQNSPTWPNPFHALGFRPYLIGQAFRPPGSLEKVRPDVILRDTLRNRVLLAEAKSGHTVEPTQIAKLQDLTSQAIAEFVSVDEPLSLVHDVVIVCRSEETIWIVNTLEDTGIHAPVLAISHEEITHHGGAFRDPSLNSAFANPITITDAMAEPDAYIPFDGTSAAGDVADVVTQRMVILMHDRVGRFSADDLIDSALGGLRGILSDGERHEMREVVKRVMGRAGGEFLREYIRRETGHRQPIWSIIKNPYEMAAAHRSKSLEAFKRRSAELAADLRGEPWPPEQMPLDWIYPE